MRFDIAPIANGMAPKRFQGKDMTSDKGNRKCIATIITIDRAKYVGGNISFFCMMIADRQRRK
jgi:hypothetical protein